MSVDVLSLCGCPVKLYSLFICSSVFFIHQVIRESVDILVPQVRGAHFNKVLCRIRLVSFSTIVHSNDDAFPYVHG